MRLETLGDDDDGVTGRACRDTTVSDVLFQSKKTDIQLSAKTTRHTRAHLLDTAKE
jgi:hypothetical protein